MPNYQTTSDRRASILAKRENRNRSDSKRISGGGGIPSSAMNKNNVQDSQASPTRPARSQYGDRENIAQIPRPTPSAPSLLLDPASGQVIDEVTGRAYYLKPAGGQGPY